MSEIDPELPVTPLASGRRTSGRAGQHHVGAGPLSWSGSVTDSLNALQLNPLDPYTRGRGLRTPM